MDVVVAVGGGGGDPGRGEGGVVQDCEVCGEGCGGEGGRYFGGGDFGFW